MTINQRQRVRSHNPVRGMNEVMLLFSVAPARYRKILFLLKHMHQKSKRSLASHYVTSQGHLIGPGVEVWEFDFQTKRGKRIF